jgi:integrase
MPTRIKTCGSPRWLMRPPTMSRLSLDSMRWVNVHVAMPAMVHSMRTVDSTSPHLNTSARVSSGVDSTRIFDQSASISGRRSWWRTPLRNRNFRRDVALGLKVTPHNLRDTAASLAIQAGASVVAVARLLGHESAATTLNHYAGLFPTDLDDVARRLDAAARHTLADQPTPSDTSEPPTNHRPERSTLN